MRPSTWCSLLVALLLATAIGAAPEPVRAAQASAPSPAGLAAYLAGLEALRQARWANAVSAFGRALEAAGDDPTFVLARGVALTLSEQFPQALADLQRAERLGLKGREAKLWTYAAEAMSGQVSPEHRIGGGGPRSLQRTPEAQRLGSVVSVPGHVMQGGQDYSTAYASFIINQMAMPYQTARTEGGNVQAPPLRQALAEAGRRFAEKWLTRPDLALAHLGQARELHAAQNYEGTLAAVARARAAYPGDPALTFYAGDSWLALGRPATARRELTIALTGKTDFAGAYLGRALAAARLGDGPRVKTDLDAAAVLDAAAAGRARSAIEAELSRARTAGAPDSLVAELERGARGGAPLEQLIDVALRLHKVSGERRLRFDEIYQERRRVLEAAVRANPRSPDKLFELGRYITNESTMRGESVEPRRPLVPYRWQASKEAELAQAEQVVDQALALDGKHLRAIMQKAMIRLARRQYADAEALVNRALGIAPNDPDALQMYARFRLMKAADLAAQAAALRTPTCSSSSSLETRSDGLYRVTTTNCTPPSPAALQRAAQLDAEAAEERRKADAAIRAALRASKGTVQGYVLEAEVQIMRGQPEAAAKAYEAALKLDPKSFEAHEGLIDLYAKTGQTEKAEEYTSFFKNTFVQTTAAHMLRLAAGRITKTAWQGARTTLAAARQLDPVDPRVPVYLSVVLDGDSRPAEATAARRMALALEEARLRLDETQPRAGAPLGRDPLDLAVMMGLRLRLAGTAARANQAAEALDLYRRNLGHAPQIAPAARGTLMYPAVLPDPALPMGTVPGPVNAATLLAESHLGAGRALRALGRLDEAMLEFSAVMAFAPKQGIPRIGTAKGDTNFADEVGAPVGEAAMELARVAVRAGDYGRAVQVLQAGTGSLPNHLRAEANELNMQIARNYRGGPGPGGPAPTPSPGAISQPGSVPSQGSAPPSARDSGPPREGPGRGGPPAQAARQTGDTLDPALVGMWEGTIRTPQGPARLVYMITPDGTYLLSSRGPSSRVEARGRASTQDGQLILVNDQGRRSEGAYQIVGRTLRIQTETGTLQLERR